MLECGVMLIDCGPIPKLVALALCGGMTPVRYSLGPAILGRVPLIERFLPFGGSTR